MNVDNKKIEEFENNYKDIVYEKIGETVSSQQCIINKLSEVLKNLGEKNVEIPNSGTTINNKLVELSNQFKNAGISIYADYENADISFIGGAIIHDLVRKLTLTTNKLLEFNQVLCDESMKRNKRVLAKVNVDPITKFLRKIKAKFIPIKPIDISLIKEERDAIYNSLNEYKNYDSKLWNYKLEDNIVPVLVRYISEKPKDSKPNIHHRYTAYEVPGLLEKYVNPNFKKLGFEHLIPELQQALIEEYKKDLPDPKVYKVKDEYLHFFVPNFSEKEVNKHEVKEEKNQETLNQETSSNKLNEKDDEITRD